MTSLAPDLGAARAFLVAMCGDSAVTFQAFDDSPAKRQNLARVYHGTLDQHADALARANAAGAGVYWTVAACDGRGRRIEHYRQARAAWVDLDTPDLAGLAPLPPPTAIVRTAAGHHVYWRYIDGCADITAEQSREICRRIAHACGGDQGATDAVRVMRVPGFWHLKGEPVMVEVVEMTDAEYDPGELLAVLPELPAEPERARRAPPLALPPATGDGSRYGLAALDAETRRVEGAPEGARNHALNRAAHSVAQLVAGGELPATALDVVAEAGVRVGLVAGEVRATVASAARAGLARPRTRPAQATAPGGAAVMRPRAPLALVAADGHELSAADREAADLQMARASLPLRWYIGRDGVSMRHAVDHAAAAIIMCGDPAVRGRISYDRFRGQLVTMGEVPAGPGLLPVDPGTVIDDKTEGAIQGWLASAWPQGKWDVSHVRSGLLQVARTVQHDSLAEWARQCAGAWDGVDRVSTAGATYFGSAAPSAQLAARLWLLATASRALFPGTKADSVLVLTGPEGIGKSMTVEALCPRPSWFLRGLPPLTGEESARFLSGKFIVEIDELDAFRRADGNRVKAFLSRPTDTLRWIYERNSTEQPRRCGMVVTLNPDAGGWLTEAMGLRRWYTVDCVACDPRAAERDAAQLWGQAISMVLAGQTHWPTAEERALLGEAAAEHAVEDSQTAWVHAWLASPERRGQSVITSDLLLALGYERHQIKRADEMRAAQLLRDAGYVQRRELVDGVRLRRWYPPMEE